jgi:hypothetical protein
LIRYSHTIVASTTELSVCCRHSGLDNQIKARG